QPSKELIPLADRLTVHPHHGVALQQPGLRRRSTSLDGHHQESAFLAELAAQGLGKPYRLGADTEVGAPNAAVSLQVFRNRRGSLDRNCAADATPEVPAVDPDHPTGGAGFDRGAAGADLNRIITLDDVVGGQHEAVSPDNTRGRPVGAGVDTDDAGRRSFEDASDITGQIRECGHVYERTPAPAIR